jgi:hypothetical protein
MKYLWESVYLHLFFHTLTQKYTHIQFSNSQINVKECVMLSNMLLFPLRIREEMIYKDSYEVDVEPFVDGSLLSSYRLCNEKETI